LVNGGLIVDGSGLRAELNASTLTLTGNEIAIKNGGVGIHQLNSSAFTNGLTGGSGAPVGINFDPTTLYLKFGTQLSVSAFPANSVTFNSLDSAWFGSGLIFDTPNQVVKTVLTDVDSTTIYKDLTGRLSLLVQMSWHPLLQTHMVAFSSIEAQSTIQFHVLVEILQVL
jgi:hypothetical protein